MPLLLYCVTLPHTIARPAEVGEVRSLEAEGLRCYFADASGLGRQLADPEGSKRAAVAFYGVNENLFRQVAIIPFRFPIVLDDQEAIVQELGRHARGFRRALERLADDVQVELRVSAPPAIGAQPVSGSQYMQARSAREKLMAQSIAQLRSATAAVTADWRERRQRDQVRCYALVARKNYGRFVETARAERLSGGIECRLTGPWPATEFLDLEMDSGQKHGLAPGAVV